MNIYFIFVFTKRENFILFSSYGSIHGEYSFYCVAYKLNVDTLCCLIGLWLPKELKAIPISSAIRLGNGNFPRAGPLAQCNLIEQAVDSGLRELRIFGFNISIDEFFNLSNESQLFILDFLGIRSHARAVGVFDHLNHNLWSRRCQLNRQNAICALASNRNPYSLNNLQYSPALDSHIDRVRDLTSRDILLEHQNLDDFICHSSHWEHVMDELKEHPKFLVADILL